MIKLRTRLIDERRCESLNPDGRVLAERGLPYDTREE